MPNSDHAVQRRLAATVLFLSSMIWFRPALPNDSPRDPYADNRPADLVAWRKAITLVFEDGQQLGVLLRRTPPVILANTDSIATEYPAMKAAAEAGNANAAFALYSALFHCSVLPSSATEAELDIERLRNSRQLRIGRYPYVVTLPADIDLAQFEAGIRQNASMCEGVTEAQKAAKRHWLDVSMRGGVAWAFKHTAQNLPEAERYTSSGLQSWDAVWRTGSVAALGWMASIYKRGISDSTGQQPDLLRAYAYQYLYARLMREKATASGAPIADRHATEIEVRLADWATQLTPGQRQEAARIAREVLIANENCCYLD